MGLFAILKYQEKVLVDADVLYENADVLKYLHKEYSSIYISVVSINRIYDDISNGNEKKSCNASRIISIIKQAVAEGYVMFDIDTPKGMDYRHTLVNVARSKGMDLCTENLSISSISEDVWVIKLKDLIPAETIYKGYKEFNFSSDEYNLWLQKHGN